MRHSTELTLVAVLLLVTTAYAVAEEVSLVTYYPSPRGVYDQLRSWGLTTLAEQSGNVGIGTTTPGSGNPDVKLEVLNTAARRTTLRVRNANAGGGGSDEDANVELVNSARSWTVQSQTAGNFQINDNTGNSTRLAITPLGNVGIGTAAPAMKLYVNDAAKPMIGVGNNDTPFGAVISGDDNGAALFGTNLYVANPNATLRTVATHTSGYGYAGMQAGWGDLQFFAQDGDTTADGVVTPGARLIIQGDGTIYLNGNVESLSLGGVRRYNWPGVDVGAFTGGHDNANYGGQPLKTVRSMTWMKCSFRNKGGFPTGFTTNGSTFGPGSCHYRRYDNNGDDPGGSRWSLMAACPDGWKIISGGGFNYDGTTNDFRPDSTFSSHPNTFLGFKQTPSGEHSPDDAAGDAQEGWVVGIRNSSGFDAGIVYALCGSE